jgi:hypothetical protein
VKPAALIAACLLSFQIMAQGHLGQDKATILKAYHDCTTMDNYPQMVVVSCGGLQTIFYFKKGADSTCDMYATDMYAQTANTTLQQLLQQGFKLTETKYVLPFLALKHSGKEKFPAHVYSNGTMDYCFIPVSLNGRTAELNSIVVVYSKKKE